jgi:cytochrome P450
MNAVRNNGLREVPQIPKLKAFMDSRRMTDNPVGVMDEYRKLLGNTFSFHFGGIKKALVTCDPAYIQHILKDNYENYPKSEIEMKRMVHFLGKGLLTSHGKYWFTQRRLIQQGFHKSRLARMMEGMHSIMDDTLAPIENSRETINIHEQMNMITFRMAMQSLFNTRLSDDELNFISNTITDVQGFMVKQIVQPYLNPWFRLNGDLHKYETMRYRSDKIIFEHIIKRRAEGNQYDDLLQILMDARYSDTGEGMSDAQILAETIQLMVAGHETTSTSLSWTFYLLSKHPEVLAKIREEIIREIGEAPIQFSDLPRFEYMAQVIDEVLRLYPPFWMVDRVALNDDSIAGMEIPKGTTVIIFIYGAHHSPEYWEDPESFNPDRFNGESRKKQNPYIHIPFGAGPKGCIGGNYATMQMMLILSTMLRKFDFRLATEKNVDIQSMLILRPRDGIQMEFYKKGMAAEPVKIQGMTA